MTDQERLAELRNRINEAAEKMVLMPVLLTDYFVGPTPDIVAAIPVPLWDAILEALDHVEETDSPQEGAFERHLDEQKGNPNFKNRFRLAFARTRSQIESPRAGERMPPKDAQQWEVSGFDATPRCRWCGSRKLNWLPGLTKCRNCGYAYYAVDPGQGPDEHV